MTPLNKLLKIALPVTTVTSATILTAWLISRSPELLNQEQDKDLMLTDFEEPIEEFKEGLLSEAIDGDESNKEDPVDEVAEEGTNKDNTPKSSPDGVPDLVELAETIVKLPKEGPTEIPEGSFSLPSGLNSDLISAPQTNAKGSTVIATENDLEQASSTVHGSDQKVNKGGDRESSLNEVDQQREQELQGQRTDSEQSADSPEGKAGENLESLEPSSSDNNSIESSESLPMPDQEKASLGGEESEGERASEDAQESSRPSDSKQNDGSDSSFVEKGSLEQEALTQSQEGAPESSLQGAQNQVDRGSVDGNSDETKFDLSELTRWESDLLSTEGELDKALSEI